MNANFDFGYCREILAFLAVCPEGVELEEVKQHTARRVRAKKTFEEKFGQSLETILKQAPFELKGTGKTQVIVPATRTAAPVDPDPAVTSGPAMFASSATLAATPTPRAIYSRPFNGGRFEAIMLEKLLPVGVAKFGADLKEEVRDQAGKEGMTFPDDTFDPLFLVSVASLSHSQPRQLAVEDGGNGDFRYSRLF